MGDDSRRRYVRNDNPIQFMSAGSGTRIMKYRCCIWMIGWIVAGAVSVAAQTVNCDLCGKAITGNYMTYRGPGFTINVCRSCDQTSPRCNDCKLPFKASQLIHHKGEWLCPRCLNTAIYCSLCDHRITGRYIEFPQSHQIFCESCDKTYPKCLACKKPTRPQQLDRTTGICFQCLKTLPRCQACGKPILEHYFRYEFSEGVFCEDCHKNRPKCYTCGVPVGERYWRFPDGREICDACNRRAVIDAKQVQQIMAEVEKTVPRLVGIQAMQPYKLTVETLNNQSAISAKEAKNGQSNQSPLYGTELGLYRRLNGDSEIFLLYGLPIEMIYETAAHEYAHAWQAENTPKGQSKELQEGFAQWVAAQVLHAKGYKKAYEKLEARRDNPYGTGYHRIQARVDRYGRKRMIQYVKTTLE